MMNIAVLSYQALIFTIKIKDTFYTNERSEKCI